ncbi:MAG TPA: hypothetical protein VJ690_04495 [Burkholderiales bacterium]|nr:hypothetical protein [Burkholderiales bacterium]
MVGKVGTRSALRILHSAERADGSRQVSQEFPALDNYSTTVRCEVKDGRGGLRFIAGGCGVTLRDVGPFMALRADHCAAQCDMGTVFIDRRGHCELLP